MQVIYTAKNFDATNTAMYNRVLALTNQSCGVAIHTQEGQLQFLGFYDFVSPLNQNEAVFFDFVRSQEVLRANFKQTYVVTESIKSTLVPTKYFDELFTENYLRHLYDVEKGEVVKTCDLFNGETKMVYCVEEHLYYPAKSKYYDAVVEPLSASYVRKAAKQYHNKLNVYLSSSALQLVHAVNGKPVFFNSFENGSVEEAAYYILNYYKVFNIDHKSLPIVFHGDLHPQLKEVMKTYAGMFETAQPLNQDLNIPTGFKFAYLVDFSY